MTEEEFIQAHREAVATILADLPGITSAYALAPEKLDTADLPAAYTFTGQATRNYAGDGEEFVIVQRTYRLQIAVLPTGQATPSERESLCVPLIGRVCSTLDSYPTLNGIEWVNSSKIISDSGVVILPEWGAKFVGFEIRLQVEYFTPRTYAVGE